MQLVLTWLGLILQSELGELEERLAAQIQGLAHMAQQVRCRV
jgi:hypothetical protein